MIMMCTVVCVHTSSKYMVRSVCVTVTATVTVMMKWCMYYVCMFDIYLRFESAKLILFRVSYFRSDVIFYLLSNPLYLFMQSLFY